MSIMLPEDAATLLRKKKQLKRELSAQDSLLEKRIAILGGSTTDEVADLLELQLLVRGIRPVIYQSGYNQYLHESLQPEASLKQFAPDLVYIHTTQVNINQFPSVTDQPDDVDVLLHAQLQHFTAAWDGIKRELNCPIIQNNFEEPWFTVLGNIDGSDYRGKRRFISRLNELFFQASQQRPDLIIHDIHHLSTRIGINNWFSNRQWHLYKYAIAMDGIVLLTRQLAGVIAGIYGLSKKCLVLDLDNTLWGGVIGDDGVEGIVIGSDSAEAEAYTLFQHYVLSLKQQGVLLAVCSKNEEASARLGFNHPESVLQTEDFSCFIANWENKPDNLIRIAEELNISLDSLVFIDDNPSEREIVRQYLPMVSTPEPAQGILSFIQTLNDSFLFEKPSITVDDSGRSRHYAENKYRQEHSSLFTNYDEFLKSLKMQASIQPFCQKNLERIVQLTNKTNQFNLTNKRCTISDIQAMAESNQYITLTANLLDRFGDNGLVSVLAGRIQGKTLHIELWLMSCRVLKRGLEIAMMKKVFELALAAELHEIVGYHLHTRKNIIVNDLYGQLGFTLQSRSDTESVWTVNPANSQTLPACFINTEDGNQQ